MKARRQMEFWWRALLSTTKQKIRLLLPASAPPSIVPPLEKITRPLRDDERDAPEDTTLASIPAETLPAMDIPLEERPETATTPEPQRQLTTQRRYPSLYDRALDPPDYVQEAPLHPHVKIHPAPPGKGLRGGWKIVGASHRGFGHAYDGRYREDDFAICYIPAPTREGKEESAAVLIAIADGVGSKTYAHYGALAAVEGATSNFVYLPRQSRVYDLITQLHSSTYSENAHPPSTAIETDSELPSPSLPDQCVATAHQLLSQAMEDAWINVMKTASKKKLSPADLHSTLLVFLAIPLSPDYLFVASSQVGDGALFLRQEGEGTPGSDYWNDLQRAQIYATGNEVLPLLSANQSTWNHYFRCGIYRKALFLMGMTDGTANDIEPPFPQQGQPTPDPYIRVESFYVYLKRAIDGTQIHEEGAALSRALQYRKPRSYDDRTVICLYRTKPEDL